MIVGIGIDLVKNERIKAAVERWRERFLKRIFTPGEQDYAYTHTLPYPHLSGRFAVKEAMLKALGTGLRKGVRWAEIEVFNNPQGKPEVKVTGRAQELLLEQGVTTIHVSITHDNEYSIGQVILTR
jgi:holo-[acyl-carrier protein] synthase